MNKRIKELAEQAKKYVDAQWAKEGSPVYPEAHYLFLQQRDEKFAELIVRECARISVDADQTMTNQGTASAQAFMEHFGIE